MIENGTIKCNVGSLLDFIVEFGDRSRNVVDFLLTVYANTSDSLWRNYRKNLLAFAESKDKHKGFMKLLADVGSGFHTYSCDARDRVVEVGSEVIKYVPELISGKELFMFYASTLATLTKKSEGKHSFSWETMLRKAITTPVYKKMRESLEYGRSYASEYIFDSEELLTIVRALESILEFENELSVLILARLLPIEPEVIERYRKRRDHNKGVLKLLCMAQIERFDADVVYRTYMKTTI